MSGPNKDGETKVLWRLLTASFKFAARPSEFIPRGLAVAIVVAGAALWLLWPNDTSNITSLAGWWKDLGDSISSLLTVDPPAGRGPGVMSKMTSAIAARAFPILVGSVFVSSGIWLVFRRPMGGLLFGVCFVLIIVWTVWRTGLQGLAFPQQMLMVNGVAVIVFINLWTIGPHDNLPAKSADQSEPDGQLPVDMKDLTYGEDRKVAMRVVLAGILVSVVLLVFYALN